MGICCDVAHVSECIPPEWHIYLDMSVYVSDLSLKSHQRFSEMRVTHVCYNSNNGQPP